MYRKTAILAALSTMVTLTSFAWAEDVPAEVLPEEPIPLMQSVEAKPLDREVIVDRHANGKTAMEREVAMDHEENFINHGTMRLYNESGKFIGGGDYDWGNRVGKWTRIYQSASEATVLNQVALRGFKAPFISEATFTAGQLDGLWIITDSAGKLVVQWEFTKGTREGHWAWFNANGDVRQQINYSNNQIQGDVIAYSGKKNPQVLQRYIAGQRLVDDSEKYPTGRQKKQGVVLMPKQITKVNVDWWNGIVEETVVRTDGEALRHGEYRYWHANGRPQLVGAYNSGRETGQFTWFYDNGQKQAEGVYVDGQRDGTWTEYYSNGQLKGTGQYAGGLRSGGWRTWFDNGMRQRDAQFQSGQQIGSVRVWNRTGIRVNAESQSPEIAEKTEEEVSR